MFLTTVNFLLFLDIYAYRLHFLYLMVHFYVYIFIYDPDRVRGGKADRELLGNTLSFSIILLLFSFVRVDTVMYEKREV